MDKKSEQNRLAGHGVLTRRQRIALAAFRVLGLVGGIFCLLVFLTVMRVGYLSSIGITLGALLTVPAIMGSVAGLAGRKRLEKLLSSVCVGTIIMIAIAGVLAFSRPQDSGTWHPYRFDGELAAIEAKRAVPDTENAAPRYEAVFRQTDERDEPNCLFTGTSRLRGEFQKQPWKSSDHPEASAWLDSRSQAIDTLLEIGRLEKCRWPVQADGSDKYTVPYGNLRHCTLLLIAAANRDLGEGRTSDALTKCLCTLRIADHIRQQPSQVDCFTGFGCEGNGLQIIRDLLVQYNLSDEDIARIAAHLPPAADPWPEEWARLLEHEKLHYMNFLGRLYERDDQGHVRFATRLALSAKDEQKRKDANNTDRLLWVRWLMTMPFDPHGVRSIADGYFTEVERLATAQHLPRMVRHEGHARPSWSDFAKAWRNAYRWGAETFFFNEHEYVEHRQRRTSYIAARRRTWLVLGLRRYRDAHGAWPQSLDTVSKYVPPEAFFDPTAEGPFVYAPDGDSFRLYSRDLNGIDEGGRRRYVKALHKSEDDIPIWPPPAPEPEDKLTEDELLKQMEQIYGKEYVETYMKKDKGSDKQ
jgi:hypothetical protein